MRISFSSLLNIVLSILFLFGSVLYFFGDLDNPKIPSIFPLAKDALWIGFSFLIILISMHKSINNKYYLVGGYFLLLSTFLIILIINSSLSFPIEFAKVFKNLFLYVFIAVFVFGILLKILPQNQFLYSFHDIILLSLAVSIVFHIFHPLESLTGRFFGTFGSPNGAGFVACSALLYMFLMIDLKICTNKRIYITTLISITALILSASLSSIAASILFVFFYYLIKFKRAQKFYIKKSYLLPFFIIIILSSTFLFQLINSESVELIARISAINPDNDTILIRVVDSLKVINMNCPSDVATPYLLGCQNNDYVRLDSTLFSFAYNLGYLAAFLFLIILYLPIISNFLKSRFLKIEFMPSLLAFYYSVIPINLLIQHSFELFPTNIIYASFMALTIFYSSKKKMLYN